MKICVFDSKEELFQNAAQYFTEVAAMAIADRGCVNVALAGGSTPKGLYQLLSTPDYVNNIRWEKVNVFFGDERCVPLDHKDSNYKMACEAFLNTVPIPASQIFPMRTDAANMQACAEEYSQIIRDKLPQDDNGASQFDLIFLGMGEDGHTASLFPETDILNESEKLVAGVYVEKMQTWRLSLTYPTINNANNVMMLVAGEGKAKVLGKVLSGTDENEPYPIQRINPTGNLVWYLDKSAASQLQD